MRRIPVWLVTCAAVAIIPAMLVAFVALSTRTSLVDDASAAGNSSVSLVVLIYGALIAAALFAAFVAVRRTRSRIYPPLLTTTGALYAYLALIGANAFDLYVHDLKPRWRWAYQPEVRILGNVLLLTFIGGLAWLLAVLIVEGREMRPRVVFAWFVLVALLVAAGLAVAVAVAQRGLI